MITRSRIHAEDALRKFGRKNIKRQCRAVLGNSAGTILIADRDGYVYARLLRDTGTQLVQARNTVNIQQVSNLPILLEETASGYRVVGIDSNDYRDNPMAGTIGNHATQHLIANFGQGGFDGLPIYNRALIELKAQAQATPDMTLYVNQGRYAWIKWAGG